MFKHYCYNTSGAKETIFANERSRNSRATGPKTRVPRGFPSLLITTAALSLKRINIPFRRLTPDLVRTITALITSDFF